ncbi:MAG: hypothetical protein GWP17_00035, partial [Aquificales bacterium]|nr:hypothetical protein [Aquificales bacterium]
MAATTAPSDTIAFALLVDTTGSMGNAIANIKSAAGTIPGFLTEAFSGQWTGKITEFRDDVTPVVDWTTDKSSFDNGIN